MTDEQREQIAAAVELGKREILEDIASGKVPETVESFSDLHDYVDANEYGGLTDPSLYAAVQDALNEWLEAGRPSLTPTFVYFRFDTRNLTDEQLDYLAGEVIAQGEASEGHPDVKVAQFDHAQLADAIRAAHRRARDGADTKLGGDDQRLYLVEVASELAGLGE